jgi:hypothetical protein
VGVAFAKSGFDGEMDTVGIVEHVVVPEAQDPVAFRFDK